MLPGRHERCDVAVEDSIENVSAGNEIDELEECHQ